MTTTAEVYLWGTRIGILHQDSTTAYASFEYDTAFLKSNIELAPLMMPLTPTVYAFPLLAGSPFHGLPGLFTDSLPDTFGNRLIEHWLDSHGRTLRDFTAIDRLCYTGKRGMGALEYVPTISDILDTNEAINVSEMVKFASDILGQRSRHILDYADHPTYAQLVQVGSSAGGARAKALIAWNRETNEIRSGQLDLRDGFDYWLMKFDNVSKNGDHGMEDGPQYTLIEYAYYLMAIDAGIQMTECRIYKTANENHFMTKRFDRENGRKVHMQSLSALTHIPYTEPGLCSYEMAASYMRQIGLTTSEIQQFYRRMVFNCLAVNQDDHVKNISFLMDRQGRWHLSPAYDITFSYNPENKWLRAHQMTVNQKSDQICHADLIAAGDRMGLKKRKCENIISEVSGVVQNFQKYAEKSGLREEVFASVMGVIGLSTQNHAPRPTSV